MPLHAAPNPATLKVCYPGQPRLLIDIVEFSVPFHSILAFSINCPCLSRCENKGESLFFSTIAAAPGILNLIEYLFAKWD